MSKLMKKIFLNVCFLNLNIQWSLGRCDGDIGIQTTLKMVMWVEITTFLTVLLSREHRYQNLHYAMTAFV